MQSAPWPAAVADPLGYHSALIPWMTAPARRRIAVPMSVLPVTPPIYRVSRVPHWSVR